MDPVAGGIVKEELLEQPPPPPAQQQDGSGGGGVGTAEVPRPMEGLHEAGLPPFLTKMYDLLEDPSTDAIMSWSRAGKSFIMWDLHVFADMLFPRLFKHSSFFSFVRQLNTYMFKFAAS